MCDSAYSQDIKCIDSIPPLIKPSEHLLHFFFKVATYGFLRPVPRNATPPIPFGRLFIFIPSFFHNESMVKLGIEKPLCLVRTFCFSIQVMFVASHTPGVRSTGCIFISSFWVWVYKYNLF